MNDSVYVAWAYDCVMLWDKLTDFRKPGKGMDVAWARDADVLFRHADKVCLRLWRALQSGAVNVEEEDRETLRQCRKLTLDIKSRLAGIIALIKADSKAMAFLLGPNGLPEHRKKTVTSDFSAGSKDNDLVFKCLCRALPKSESQRLETSPPAQAKRPPILHQVINGVIYWEDPEPLPKPPSAIEIERERRATLAARVQQESHRSAFKSGGTQPRSQFRRFRN